MTRTRITDPESRRRQILLATEQALNEKGFHNVRLDDVARHARISKGTLYLYFRDKDGLINAFVKDIAAQAVARISAIPGLADMPPMQQLQRAVESDLSFFREHMEFFAQFSVINPEIYGKATGRALQENFKQHVEFLARKLEQCMNAKMIRVHDPFVGSLALISLIRMTALYESLRKSRSPRMGSDEILSLFLNGFGCGRK